MKDSNDTETQIDQELQSLQLRLTRAKIAKFECKKRRRLLAKDIRKRENLEDELQQHLNRLSLEHETLVQNELMISKGR